VLTVIPFDTEAEAIRIANGTNYGLASSAYCDIKKATSGEREAGTCWINCYNIYDVSVPFEATKHLVSGESGKEVMENYTHTKFGSI